MQLIQKDVERDEAPLYGYHHRRDKDQEDQVLAGELEPAEGIGGQGSNNDYPDHHRYGIEKTVQEIAVESALHPGLVIILEVERLGDNGHILEDRLLGLQTGRDHPE